MQREVESPEKRSRVRTLQLGIVAAAGANIAASVSYSIDCEQLLVFLIRQSRVNSNFYNNCQNSRALIGSRLLSIRVQTMKMT